MPLQPLAQGRMVVVVDQLDRLTVSEAAKRLEVSTEAIRQRIRRGTIEYDQDDDGKYYVYLQSTEGVENNVHNNSALQDHIETLKRELELRNEELRRKDHIIAALVNRVPVLEPAREASPEPSGEPVSHSENSDNGGVPPEQEERRSWWRWLFDG